MVILHTIQILSNLRPLDLSHLFAVECFHFALVIILAELMLWLPRVKVANGAFDIIYLFLKRWLIMLGSTRSSNLPLLPEFEAPLKMILKFLILELTKIMVLAFIAKHAAFELNLVFSVLC